MDSFSVFLRFVEIGSFVTIAICALRLAQRKEK
jgi:hypothetical protein